MCECEHTHIHQQNKTKQSTTQHHNENTTKQNPGHQVQFSDPSGNWVWGEFIYRQFMHMHVGAVHTLPVTRRDLPTVPGGKKREIPLTFSATCLGSSRDRLKPRDHNSSFTLYLPMNPRVETFLFDLPGTFRQKKTTPDKSTGSSLPSLFLLSQ